MKDNKVIKNDDSPTKVEMLVMDKNEGNITAVSAKQDGPSPLRSQSPFKVADVAQKTQSDSKDDSLIKKEMKGSSGWVVAAPTSNRPSLLKL